VNAKLKISFLALSATGLFLSTPAYAQLDDNFRRQNAVVLYEFMETSGDIQDTADMKFGARAPLRIHAGLVNRAPGVLEINGGALIRSLGPVTKLYQACTASNEMSIELDFEPRNSVEKLTSNVSKQPMRIINFGNGLLKQGATNNYAFRRNFIVGQFYDGGDLYQASVSNTSNSSLMTPNSDNVLREPIESDVAATFVERGEEPGQRQTMIFTYKAGSAKLYLSDKDGRLFPHKKASVDFGGPLSTWRNDAFLTLGNENFDPADMNRIFQMSTSFASCDRNGDPLCGNNPNRFWKGRFYKVAIYCKELTQEDIFGKGSFRIVTNPTFPINVNLKITPELTKAQEIHLRLTGAKTPLTNPVLEQMAQLLQSGDSVGAAALATKDPKFYSITVRDFAARMSNRDETQQTPLNDFIATFIGAVRDEINAKRLLTDNLTYVADPSKAAVPNNLINDILRSNNHYETLGNERYDLAAVLVPTTQKLFNGRTAVENRSPAGVLTSRQWLASHAIAGTNRRPVEFALREFLCSPLETVADNTGPDNVVGRDIDRFPGGSHSKYVTTCRGCHTIMDGFRPAFARYTFSNGFVKHAFEVPAIANDPNIDENTSMGMKQYPAKVALKLNHNETVFPGGKVIEDDSWVNNAVLGANKTKFAWDRVSGKGIKEFGELLANSKQFPICMAERIFQIVCKRSVTSDDMSMIQSAAQEFASANRNYNLKFLFQKIVTSNECLGGK